MSRRCPETPGSCLPAGISDLASPRATLAARELEQAADRTLRLGPRGEHLLEHHHFYAAFETPDEYRRRCCVRGDRTPG